MTEEFGKTIRAAREARELTQADIARELKVSRAAVGQWEAGETEPKRANLRLLAKFLGLDAAALEGLTGIPPDPPGAPAGPLNYKPPPRFFDDRDRMPVYSAAEGGSGTMILADEIDRIPRPYTLEGISEAYGILIAGESMLPAFKPGDTAWVNPRLPPIRDGEAIFYQVDDIGGGAVALIKQLASWTDREWTVEQWNPAKKYKLDRGLWRTHHRVVGKFSRR